VRGALWRGCRTWGGADDLWSLFYVLARVRPGGAGPGGEYRKRYATRQPTTQHCTVLFTRFQEQFYQGELPWRGIPGEGPPPAIPPACQCPWGRPAVVAWGWYVAQQASGMLPYTTVQLFGTVLTCSCLLLFWVVRGWWWVAQEKVKESKPALQLRPRGDPVGRNGDMGPAAR